MSQKLNIHYWEDWSSLPPMDDSLRKSIVHGNSPIVHEYDGRLWTSGYVGVVELNNAEGKPLSAGGCNHIAVINPRFNLNPLVMLREVLKDEEYSSYVDGIEDDEEDFLYKVFYDYPTIRLPRSESDIDSLIYAMSFIDSCYRLCRKGLKRTIVHRTENFTAKIKGRIDAKRNITQNTSHGRNDRFACTYTTLQIDNIENQILKSTLKRCKRVFGNELSAVPEMMHRIRYCETALKSVSDVFIKPSDMKSVSATGLYAYYQSALLQARCILLREAASVRQDGDTVSSSLVYTTQYLINMERLFEFYARSMTKRALLEYNLGYKVAPYSQKWYLLNNSDDSDLQYKPMHLIHYCIPDIVILGNNDRAIMVMDAKYKAHDRTNRSDSHQLFSYIVVTGAMVCGFILPYGITEDKVLDNNGARLVEVSAPYSRNKIDYCEVLLTSEIDSFNLACILDSVLQNRSI